MISSGNLFYLSNRENPKDIHVTVIYNIEKQYILKPKKLEPVNACYFYLVNDLNNQL